MVALSHNKANVVHRWAILNTRLSSTAIVCSCDINIGSAQVILASSRYTCVGLSHNSNLGGWFVPCNLVDVSQDTKTRKFSNEMHAANGQPC